MRERDELPQPRPRKPPGEEEEVVVVAISGYGEQKREEGGKSG